MNLQKDFAELSTQLSKLAQTRQQLLAQLNENEGVRAEIMLLTPEAELYRTLGPSLIRTEIVDAKALVEGRIDRLKRDVKRLEEQAEEVAQQRLSIREQQRKLAATAPQTT
jgi:prefoldin beta subunit